MVAAAGQAADESDAEGDVEDGLVASGLKPVVGAQVYAADVRSAAARVVAGPANCKVCMCLGGGAWGMT